MKADDRDIRMNVFQPAIFIAHVLGLPFDLVQTANEVQLPYDQLVLLALASRTISASDQKMPVGPVTGVRAEVKEESLDDMNPALGGVHERLLHTRLARYRVALSRPRPADLDKGGGATR